MKIYDISMTIHETMTVYKNKPEKKPKITNRSNFQTAQAYESTITMDMHTGTHIDAPLHMIEGGETMSLYSIERFVVKAKVLDLTHIEEAINQKDLEAFDIQENDFILFKTRNSSVEVFDFNFVYLEKSGAKFLVDRKIQGVGIDALGIERNQPNHETHKLLLGNQIMIVEGLRLKDVPEGEYTLIVLPLKILETEAAPARAILIQQDIM
ncbi:MAG TPA: cyclase family protein [Haloplasmataceae bacterium]